jgi:hypothetical protein
MRARSGEPVERGELEARLPPVLDCVLHALDGSGPFPRDPDAALVRRLARVLPRRTPRRLGGEVRALLARRAAAVRDLAWLLRRKEAAGAAALLGLLAWAFDGANGPPPEGVRLRLAEFTNASPPAAEGLRFLVDGRRQYWAAARDLYPSLAQETRLYGAVLTAADAAISEAGGAT